MNSYENKQLKAKQINEKKVKKVKVAENLNQRSKNG